MAIKIKKKTFHSNEPATTPKIEEGKIDNAKPTDEIKVTHSGVFIDKISIVVDVPSEDSKLYYGSIFTQLKDNLVFKYAKPGKQYNTARRIALPSIEKAKKWPHFQFRFDEIDQKALAFRIEFSPIDLGHKGLEELHAVLTSLFNNGWQYFLKYGRVTRLEVTIDFPHITIEQFHVLPKQGLTSREWNKDGILESITLGKRKGNQTKVYDRGRRRRANGQVWKGPPTTRIERNLRLKPPMKLISLAELKNPFAGIVISTNAIPPPPDDPESKKYLWTMFQDSIKIRGLTAALLLLPQAKRTTYRKWIKQHPSSWWNPQAIWLQWPKYISDLKICDPLAWK